MMEAEYTIRPMAVNWYQVAKFEGGKGPENIYDVSMWNERPSVCTCPAAGRCKHMAMVEEYIRIGEPIMNCFWTDKAGRLFGVYSGVTPEFKKDLMRGIGRKKAIRGKVF